MPDRAFEQASHKRVRNSGGVPLSLMANGDPKIRRLIPRGQGFHKYCNCINVCMCMCLWAHVVKCNSLSVCICGPHMNEQTASLTYQEVLGWRDQMQTFFSDFREVLQARGGGRIRLQDHDDWTEQMKKLAQYCILCIAYGLQIFTYTLGNLTYLSVKMARLSRL